MTIIKYICADSIVISPLVIVPRQNIIVSWFHENITSHKIIIVLLSSYTNKEICMTWLDYFIKYTNSRLDKPWKILLINSTTYYKISEFILKAKINKIWVIKFLTY